MGRSRQVQGQKDSEAMHDRPIVEGPFVRYVVFCDDYRQDEHGRTCLIGIHQELLPSLLGRARVRVWPLMSRGQGPGTPRDAAIAAGGG